MSGNLTESVVEDATLSWLESLGYGVQSGWDIALGEPVAERTDFCQMVMEGRLWQALARLSLALRNALLLRLLSNEIRAKVLGD